MQLFYPLGLPSDNIGIRGFHDTTKNQSQSYIPLTGCVLSHILSNGELSSLEKMYYILADSLSYINSSKGRNRSVSFPAKSWAERLSCSKSEVFVLQKSLEDKGYFIIYRNKNDKGQNNRNTTTIPDNVFNNLKYEPDRFNLSFTDDIDTKASDHFRSDNLDSIDKTFIPTLKGKRQHLEKTKMFIRVPYQFLKELNSNCSISATSKVVLLYLFTKIYKHFVSKYNHAYSDIRYDYDNSVDDLTHNSSSFVIAYQELQQELKLHRNSLTKAFKTLEEANLIKRDQIVIKSDDDYNSRADKSLWRISLVKEPRIINDNNLHAQKGHGRYDKQEELIDKQQRALNTSNTTMHIYDQKNVVCENKALKSFTEKGCTKYDPPCTDSGQLYNKDFIVNNSIIKNIDYIDVKSKKEFLVNEQSSFPSESYNNSSFLNDPCKKTLLKQHDEQAKTTVRSTHKAVLKEEAKQKEKSTIQHNKQNTKRTELTKPCLALDKAQWRELRNFYPLSDKDTSLLNSRANREFSNNFVNQLLLKLYIKYPEKRFKNRFTFLSYMVQILQNEKHQGPLVNHTSFRFSCNIGTEEKNLLEYERYLNQIEDSLDLSKEMKLKKKIAGRFSTEVAYKILTTVKFKTNPDNSFITALIPCHLALSERRIKILSDQLEAIYGINGYYVQEVKQEDTIQPPKTKISDIDANEKSTKNLASSNKPSAISEEILENTTWNKIRKNLREELGDHIDQAWFAKAEAMECKETKTLTITMPTRLMADWIKNNYSHVIRRVADECRINRVKYIYQ